MARINLDNLRHSYGPDPRGPEDWALKRLDIEWSDGGAYALLGPSGCGKTTLLNIISGLVRPTEGRVLFDGVDLTDVPTDKRHIAQVFQFPVVYDTMTVYDNLAFPLRNRGAPEAEVKTKVLEIARMLDLEGMLQKRASGLTADGKQKISLGRGLVRPDVNVVMFDEPLTVIDPHLKWQLRSKLKELHQRIGRTMIYVTHDQTEALTFADKVVVMFDGEVVQIGTPEELFDEPAHTFVGYFIGSPGMNILSCKVKGNVARIGSNEIRLARNYGELGDSAQLGVRPEFVAFGAGGIPVQVKAVEDIGRFKIARATLDGQDINAVLPEGTPIPAEPRVTLDPARINIYERSHLVRRSA
jgi:glycerol transport system ATP-binding protein